MAQKKTAAASGAASYDPAPRSTSKEFGGTPGAFGVTFAVAFFSYCTSPFWSDKVVRLDGQESHVLIFSTGLTMACNAGSCPAWPMSSFSQFHANGFKSMQTLEWWQSLWSWEAAGVYGAWYAWTVLCWFILPGRQVEGVVLRDGSRLKYKMNGESFCCCARAAC